MCIRDRALYAARNYYSVYRELPTGKGFEYMVFIPRKKFPDKPALVVELKWDKSAKGAISQIKQKQYCKSLEKYAGNILLAGINYSKKDKAVSYTHLISMYITENILLQNIR